jgi:twitching motility two-component system response regulator PilH
MSLLVQVSSCVTKCSGLVSVRNKHETLFFLLWKVAVAQFDLFKRLFGGGGGSERREKPRVNAKEGTRMLIVDDSPTIVAMLRKFLQQNGYQTLEAGDAETGIEVARAERPDMIFLDIVLPGMNGFAALRQLRRDPVTREIPIIMISGNEQATEQFYAQRIGADDFMKKPFSRSEVFARIERLLDAEQMPKRPAPPPVVAPPALR